MESSVLEKSQVATLTLLTLSFMVGEVAHFLPTVTRSNLISLVSCRGKSSTQFSEREQVQLSGHNLDWSNVNFGHYSHLVESIIC